MTDITSEYSIKGTLTIIHPDHSIVKIPVVAFPNAELDDSLEFADTEPTDQEGWVKYKDTLFNFVWRESGVDLDPQEKILICLVYQDQQTKIQRKNTEAAAINDWYKLN
jgi:hypothetical protein